MDDDELDLKILLKCCHPAGAYGLSILLDFEPSLATEANSGYDRAHLNRIYRTLKDFVSRGYCTYDFAPSDTRGPGKKVHHATPLGRERAQHRVGVINQLLHDAIKRSAHDK
jgi:DNA-binding PadR family transcriptional regulator